MPIRVCHTTEIGSVRKAETVLWWKGQTVGPWIVHESIDANRYNSRQVSYLPAVKIRRGMPEYRAADGCPIYYCLAALNRMSMT